MKLNKVLALALSGIMAVSMLAGCSTNGNKDDNTDQGTVVTTNAADVLNKMQSTVKFSSDATLDNYMKAAESAKPTSVKNLATARATVSAVDADNVDITKAIIEKMTSKDAATVSTNNNFNGFQSATLTDTEDTTVTVFYAVDADKVISIEHLMTSLYSQLGISSFKTLGQKSSDKYPMSYTGNVSVKQLTGTTEDGTYSAYLVAVSITRTLGDKLV